MDDLLWDHEQILQDLRWNLTKAQNHIKLQVDYGFKDVEYAMDDYV